jgi:protein-tyrosine phosphatase
MADSHSPQLAIVDLHSHLVPGVDDGATTVAESLTALGALYRQGVRTVVTTPHLLLPRLETHAAIDRELELQRHAFDQLICACRGRADLPTISLGQEIWAPDAGTIRRVVGRTDVGLGGKYLLVEFGFDLQGTHLDVIQEVNQAGRSMVIAHPERYDYLPDQDPFELMQRWREAGALLQVNVGSLTGHYERSTPGSEARSWKMVELGLVDLFATDHHGPRRAGVSPAEAVDALIARGESALVKRAMMDTPGLIARGEA